MADATTPRSIRLTSSMDLDFTGGKVTKVSGLEAVRQAVKIRLQFLLGEWFLDKSLGTPWYSSILRKNPNFVLVKGIFRDRILSTPGIGSLTSLELTYDRAHRTLRVDFSATCDFGEFDDSITLKAA